MKPMEVAVYERPVIVKIDTGTSPLIITDQGSGIVTVIDPAVIKAVTLSQDVTVKVNDGIHGKDGLPGVNGLPGKDGSRGMPGNSGIQGPRGIQGITGNRGPYGLQGPRGDIGLRGIQGPQGILGLRGAQGPYGVRGAQGPAGIVDLPTILPVITGNIDIHDFIPNHALTLDQLFAFWRTIGETLLTDYPNGLSLVEVIQSTTANSIIDAVVDLRASVDGQFILAYSYIDQTAYAIDQRVTNTQRALNDKITIAESRIFQTESSILSTVSRLTDIDGPGGLVSLLQSSIDQQADSLTLEVLARQGVDNDLQESKSRITMLDDTLSLLVETFDAVNDRLTTTEITLDEKGITLSALESLIEYSISTQQNILKNSWGVVIEEDANGNTYTAGFDLIVNAIWIEDYDYIVGDAIYFNNAVYECIQNHVASVSNNPAGELATTYWSILPNGKKSEINFKVDGFNILTTAGAVPLFSADSSGSYINTNLIKTDAIVIGDLSGASTVINNASNGAAYGAGLINGTYSAYNTNRVNGTAASTVVSNASAGATAATKVQTFTAITGGIISTGLIRNSANTMSVNFNTATIKVNSTDGLIIESGGGMHVDGIVTIKWPGAINFQSSTGIHRGKIVGASWGLDISSPGEIQMFAADGPILLEGDYIGITGPLSALGNIMPMGASISIGTNQSRWPAIHATSFYVGTGGYYDELDDLYELSLIKPRYKKTIDTETKKEILEPDYHPDSGLMQLDNNTLPEWMTTRSRCVQQLHDDCGCMVTDVDVEELLDDYDEAGWMISRDIALFADLTSGAVRQLDTDVIGMFELLATRITALEITKKQGETK